MMNRVNIIGVNISAINMEESLKAVNDNFEKIKGKYICASNVHTTVMAYDNYKYREIQNNSYMSLPDGKPLSIYGRICGYTKMDRVTGPDFFENILKLSLTKGWNHYFYGNTKENLDLLIKHLKINYEGLNIVGYEPSLFRELTNKEKDELCFRINKSKADFVWVAIGAPKQECLCAELSNKTKSIWVGVGGAFNVVAGVIPRAPHWMQKMCLEWFYRLIKEPKRLFKRYFITNIKFLYYLITYR